MNSELLTRVRNGNQVLYNAWLEACQSDDAGYEAMMCRIDKSLPRLHNLCLQLQASGFDKCLYDVPRCQGDNNLVVLDCDSLDRFYELAAVICEKTGHSDILDFTAISETGRGVHIWLFVEAPVTSVKFPKLDIKAAGGYVIAPPSLHPSGKEYRFLNSVPIRQIRSLADVGIDVKQRGDIQEGNQPGWVSEFLRGVSEGQRNDAAIKLAGYFRNNLPIEATTSILELWNTRNNPPMPMGELQNVINSAYHYPPP